MKICKHCKQKIVIGRRDKIFCTVICKTRYHRVLASKAKNVALTIDRILHRNRSILYEFMGTNKKQLKLKRLVLEKNKFRFKYHTHQYKNSKGKIYHYIYDFAWMSFSDDEVLIIKK